MPTQKPAAADTDNTVSDRRQRKREQDRRCQRQLRERTRNRIAQLEQLVESFSQQDSNGQVVELMAKLRTITEDRDELKRTLQTVHTALETHNFRLDESKAGDSTTREEYSSPFVVAGAEERDTTWSPDLAMNFISPTVETTMQKLPPTQTLDGNYVFQPATVACECRLDPEPFIQQPVLWQFANQTLSQSEEFSTHTSQLEDAISDDTPVRALIEGWDAIETRLGGKLPPSWTKLHYIDQTLFATCGLPERLAILYMMHLQNRYYTDPTPHNQRKLPSWYLRRPSQDIAHSCAIDYFVWPGIRERFVFNEHRYCSNLFWQLFTLGFRILWPFEFRDCYSYNIDTNQYSLSHAFTERISDINAWAMKPSFFEPWPEFKSDIPVFNSIPAALPIKAGLMPAASRDHQSQEKEWPAIDPVTTFSGWDALHLLNTRV
ncbi:hypothetical protein K505DRAFT_378033 [Melanomma pulvis-pyrius CBS 109.77]|uniref:BZIP domain-containing protein n=1 Tax=Melanomma pulvis-pyrius CBS 109.77 TaxID=1314802 RepID=A0A6A6X041_9PLEO|nr:hypothetical protein K505DRAFT_378033 [Melanomma pulvis-pyrius CBS 109.77]